MSANTPEMLLGRLAVHYKMISMDQLSELTKLQARTGGAKKLGELLVERGHITSTQLEQLIKVQTDYLAKQRARGAPEAGTGAARPGAAAAAVAAKSRAPRETRAPQVSTESLIERPVGGVSAGSQGGRVDSIAIGREASPAPAARRAETLEIGRLAGGSRAEELEIGRPAAASSGSAQPRPSHSERPAPAASAPAAPVSSAPAASPRPVQDVGPAPGPKQVDPFLREAVGLGASDIHFHAGSPVRRRVNGALADAGADVLSPERSREMVLELLSSRERHALEQNGQIDFAYAIDGLARFRCNAYRQQNGHDLIMRAIAAEPPSLEQLNLPGNLAKFTNYHQGMVLVTGPAGCGKSSTMAALINIINEERLDHIITVEDPIEFVHVNKRCVINQRQVGPHTKSFARALKGALREDPDIIALGELRDLETISLALTAAETGHLVIATLHTGNSIRTVNRLIGVFPPNQQAQIRTMVSESLRAVISQRLVPRADGPGRAPALEILVNTKAVGNTIRDNKTFQLRSALQTGMAHGMKLLDVSLAELVRAGTITRDEALKHAEDPQKFPR